MTVQHLNHNHPLVQALLLTGQAWTAVRDEAYLLPSKTPRGKRAWRAYDKIERIHVGLYEQLRQDASCWITSEVSA